MRVLVTGASGFVGSYAVAALLGEGHEPHIFVRNPEKAARVLRRLRLTSEASDLPTHVGDIRDAGAVRAALSTCEAVLHAAADMGVTGHAADLEGANVVGLKNVLGQAVELGLDPVVHVSTVAVFVPPAEPVITVDTPLAGPRNGYGRSKVSGELYARGLDGVTIVYPGGVAGPHQPTVDALNEGFRAGVALGWPMVPGGVSVLDVRDLALFLARCMTPEKGARRYMIGGNFRTWRQLADLCEQLTGRKARRFPIPAALLRTAGSALDVVKRVKHVPYPLTRDAADFMLTLVPTDDRPALNELGVTLRPVEDTVSDTLRWLSAEGHLNVRRIGRLAP
ncbi:NAD-dependent epimerase/dehydratase family protein [Nonomuraea sp. NPDC050540]|uniref:NAD-dependent epimerase/dehydratase family protein n=1 Tax=Nonomuraea sp. NPDC050540 TaxID=3364367 RepID=UPI00379971D2